MGKDAAFLLFFLGGFYLRICFTASQNISSTDESSLLALKAHLASDLLAQNWSQNTSFCTWIGVTCSPRRPRVTGLDLSNMGLRGSIPTEIGNLSFLTFLDMSNNGISGPIPGEIGNLRRLRVLDIAFNQLSDEIPQSIGLLRKLKQLNISNNHLSGDIPTALSTCFELSGLYLFNNSLTGNIPLGFGNLTQLQYLNLKNNMLRGELQASTIFNISSLLTIEVGNNKMSGTIPKDICSQPAPKLEELWLYSNQFQGEIPSTIMHCHSLTTLSLRGNTFTGSIPTGFWNLSSLRVVYLGRNAFTGTIPPSIGNLSNLVGFDIGESNFYGSLPSQIGLLSNLILLNLQFNNLNGEVPQSLFNVSKLQRLSLATNNLSGTIPISIDKGLPNIRELFLVGNQFHGNIPHSISNLSKLTILELSDNSFTGDVPVNLGNLQQLEILNLGRNHLSNNLSEPNQDFLSSLTSCKNLKAILISSNNITGVLPKSFGLGNLSASLETFKAYYCRIISPLPTNMGNLSKLMWLHLGYNELSGEIPPTLGHLSNLQKLDIDSNKLQGSISVLCNLKKLYSINLTGNGFFGEVPPCLGNLSLLREINLGGNAFNSNIPSTLWMNDRVERMDFSNNFFHGSLSRDIGNMKTLIELDLSRNQLSGEIPSTISQLLMLTNLSLSNNKFHGPITESFADLKGLLHLDLSSNSLSGPIPKSLEALASLIFFNVSFNELSGEIPDSGPFVNFTAESFKGNQGLCGALRFKVEACEKRMPTSSIKNKPLIYTLPITAFVVVVALILVLILRCRKRKLPLSSSSDLPLGLKHERISYYEILRSTSNLDEEQLIGRGSFGSVYKGNFSDTMVVAIKVFNLDVQGALKSFDTECQVMRSVRHRNLVKVITSCSNLDFKALVMAYMPNGNLEKWLYSANFFLSIHQRMGIMIDVASALEYLHEGNTIPIVHCDLKPNNILLDEDMVAHVGDFGIAKLLMVEHRMQQTRTLGTIGYMAPEYGSEGLVSAMVDVYSYGILLIAIHESCIKSAIELALECTTDLPEERPNMKDVLVRIEKIKSNLSNHN